MLNYFEHNLPEAAPLYFTGDKAGLTCVLTRIHARMEKLNEALALSKMPGEQFATGAKILFNCEADTGEPLLDTLSSEGIAAQVKAIAGNAKYEPRENWENTTVVVDTAFLSNDEWETIRAIGIGGSDAAVTMGVSPYRTEQELYHDKVGTVFKLPEQDTGKDFIFEYGHKVEPLVIDEFCRRTGAKVIPETRMFAKKGMPYITANVDAFVRMPDGRIFVFEAKTTTSFNKDAWRDNKVPVQYIPQCRQYLAVMDDERIAGTYIGCVYGNTPSDFVCAYIERDMDREAEQLETETEFWEDYVLTGTEPEPSGDTQKDIEIIRKKTGYADKDLPAIDLCDEDIASIREYLALDEERKLLEKKAKNIKDRQGQLSIPLINRLGTAVRGVISAGDDSIYEVSYAPRSRTSVDTEKLRLAYPSLYDEIVTVNPESSRVFSIKTKKIKNKKIA